MRISRERRLGAIGKELRTIKKQEQKLEKAAIKAQRSEWKGKLEEKVPQKLYFSLESAFCKGFLLVFLQGRSLLEKSYDKEELLDDHSVRDHAVRVKGRRKELRGMHESAKRSGRWNLALTTVEGIGLGALGIGIPDIVLFLGTVLKGIYETALNYGKDYTDPHEQMLILKMMACALSSGEDYARRDAEVDRWMIGKPLEVGPSDIESQARETASVLAMDMLLLKFIQGLPLVGMIGGASNPIYYHKILKHVQMKYRKRYLLQLRKQLVQDE